MKSWLPRPESKGRKKKAGVILMVHYNSWPLGSLPEDKRRVEPEQIRQLGFIWSDPREINTLFETELEKYSGAKHVALTDCCTNALFLALKYKAVAGELPTSTIISIPKHTYVSVPMAIINAGFRFRFDDRKWSGEYELGETGIYDSAARFTEKMSLGRSSVQCLSFQIKKRLPIGRGGAVLSDDEALVSWIRLASYDGRDLTTPYDSLQHLRMFGWHMYMTPEDAARGLLLMSSTESVNSDTMSWSHYPDLTKWKIVNDLATN